MAMFEPLLGRLLHLLDDGHELGEEGVRLLESGELDGGILSALLLEAGFGTDFTLSGLTSLSASMPYKFLAEP